MKKLIFCALLLIALGCQQPSPKKSTINRLPYTIYISYSSDCPISIGYSQTLFQLLHSLPSDSFQYRFLKVQADETWDFQWGAVGQTLPESLILSKNALSICKKLGFSVYPEVAMVDVNQQLIYRGAIDDRAFETGIFRPVAKQLYLQKAIQSLRQGKAIQTPWPKAKGCFIEF